MHSIDCEFLKFSFHLYRYGLGSRLTYELTLADYSNVIKASNPDETYTICNISLEFDKVINASLASQIRTEYMKSRVLYNRILRAHIIPHLQASQWISIACQRVSRVCCSFSQKKEVPLNSIEILKNSSTPR